MRQEKTRISICVNIPFVQKRCPYSKGFSITGESAAKTRYMEALEREFDSLIPDLQEYETANIYIGGGSPTVMNPDQVGALIRRIRKSIPLAPHAEVSIEAVPNTIGSPVIIGLAAGGISRYSLEIHTTDYRELAALECPYDVADIQNAVLFLDKAKVANVNLDLTYGIPGQTLITWKHTLWAAMNFEPQHVSLYPLEMVDGEAGLRSEMLGFAMDFLKEKGYVMYARFHFCRGAFICCNIANRFGDMDYMGIGMGAMSCIDGLMYENTRNFKQYIEGADNPESIITNVVRLSALQLQIKYIMNHLQLVKGMSLKDFEEKFPKTEEVVPKIFEELIKSGLAEKKKSYFRPTSEGLIHFNKIAKITDKLIL